MSLFKPGMVVDYRLTASYDRLRKKLLTQFPDRLDQPLVNWALPTDRHLPLPLISRSLRDLLSYTLNELYATPGIGPKKVSALVVLLSRATQPLPGETIAGSDGLAEAKEPERIGTPLDTSAVSELVWEQWRANVRRLGLENESLGRFAASLEVLPRSLWAAPLGNYVQLTLADIRRLKTHGQKRIAAVLDVFASLHDVGRRLDERLHLAVHLLPVRMSQMDACVNRWLERPALATPESLQSSLVVPLLDQIRHDLGNQSYEVVGTLLRQRSQNVQEVARRVGLNRGSIYEILANVRAMLDVRWPEGQVRLTVLTKLLVASLGAERQIRLLNTVAALYFPETEANESGRDGSST
ncbi:MAG TPA: hypothetical protein VG826_14105 [Pirellulales bacterium]|nr:hypothetical protein [Pirellulales bacterium]